MEIAVVDDEVKWREQITSLIKSYLKDEVVEIYNYETAEAFLRVNKQVDLLIMDVELPGINGIEASRKYKLNYPESNIVILTTHTELMEYGYMVNALRYVDKLKISTRLPEALETVQKIRALDEVKAFSFKGYGLVDVRTKDIIYVETELRNAVIHTKDGRFVTNEPISEIEQKLANSGFFRCHKSYIINLDHVADFDNSNVYMTNGEYAMLSTRKVKAFKEEYIKRKFEYANS